MRYSSFQHRLALIGAVAGSAFVLSACGTAPMSAKPMMVYSQASLPATLQVPSGHKVAMETVGIGMLTYQCSAKKDMASQYEWAVAGPEAVLNDRSGKQIGKYYGPPATWESMDGSKLTATQLAVAPNGMGNIPSQLVKTNPALSSGSMTGVSYIQRVNTIGGIAPVSACSMANLGAKETVKYQADYIFYKPSTM